MRQFNQFFIMVVWTCDWHLKIDVGIGRHIWYCFDPLDVEHEVNKSYWVVNMAHGVRFFWSWNQGHFGHIYREIVLE